MDRNFLGKIMGSKESSPRERKSMNYGTGIPIHKTIKKGTY